MRWGDDCTFAEDGRRADPKLQPSVSEDGSRYWVLGVTLYAGRSWPADSYTRVFLWQRSGDGALFIDHGRYWPQAAEGATDDGA